ncbi:TRAP transporter large permease subunit [Acuticoccus sp.]|uniref:TRAP transporter large permease subunit n=1 Tax=Acuticoccus sp. TaxID=1904378 RepID=UPI003B51ABAA
MTLTGVRASLAGGARTSAGAADALGALCLAAIVAALTLNVVARTLSLPVVGAGAAAQALLVALAFCALPGLARSVPDGRRGLAAAVVVGFAVVTVCRGMAFAAGTIGGIEPVLGVPVASRYAVAAVLAAAALLAAARGPASALATAAGAALALAPLPVQPAAVGAAVFALALVLRVPVALALLAGVAAAPGRLSDAALAQSLMRGLSPYVLLAVPLFVLSAALMVAGGIGERMVEAARWFARRRRSALGEANVLASALFGGVSGSSVADAALGARLLVPAMVAAGTSPAQAAALTAASAVLPNVLPPSIALLLAAAATDQSVGALWVAGIGAGAVLALVLWLAARRLARGRVPEAAPTGRAALVGLAPPLVIGVVVLGGLRLGLVTSVEAGLLACGLAAAFGLAARGPAALATALREAAQQTGRVALLIAAAAPVGFLLATSGIDVAALLPTGPPTAVLAVAAAWCLVLGTVLDVGAGILLTLPILVPAAVAAGADPIHATMTLTVALLIGGLTPPVGILVLVVKDLTGASGVYRAVLPYCVALALGLAIILALPALTVGLVHLL